MQILTIQILPIFYISAIQIITFGWSRGFRGKDSHTFWHQKTDSPLISLLKTETGKFTN